MPLLSVAGLVCRPIGVPPLLGLDLSAEKRELVGVFGANGSGKGTLCRALGLFETLERGTITVNGRLLTGQPWHAPGAGVFVLQKGRRVFPDLTVLENLRATPQGWASHTGDRLERVHRLFPRLLERSRQLGRTLSGGEQQMVAIGRALLASPAVLVLEEPGLGLAPKIVNQVADALRSVADSGTAVLVIAESDSGGASGATWHPDRTYTLANGRAIEAAPPASAGERHG